MSELLNTPAYFEVFPTSLAQVNGGAAKIIIDSQDARVLAMIAGELALPGEPSVRQRVAHGGVRVTRLAAISTDTAAASVLPYIGRMLTTQGGAATGAITLTTTTIVRTLGSFVVDGWRRGDAGMLFGPALDPDTASATQANVGKLFLVGAVSALTLTVGAATFTADAVGLSAGARLIRMSQQPRRLVAANAGSADAAPGVSLMGGTPDPSTAALPDTGWEIGPGNVLAVAVVAALSTATARIDITAEVGVR